MCYGFFKFKHLFEFNFDIFQKMLFKCEVRMKLLLRNIFLTENCPIYTCTLLCFRVRINRRRRREKTKKKKRRKQKRCRGRRKRRKERRSKRWRGRRRKRRRRRGGKRKDEEEGEKEEEKKNVWFKSDSPLFWILIKMRELQMRLPSSFIFFTFFLKSESFITWDLCRIENKRYYDFISFYKSHEIL